MVKIKTTYTELFNKLAGNTPVVGVAYPVTDKIFVSTPNNDLAPVLSVIKKVTQNIVRVILDDGRTFECSEEHLFQDETGNSIRANEASVIATTTGMVRIKNRQVIAVEPTYDIEIPSPHWYVSPNGIIHHNTFFVMGIIKQWLTDNPNGFVFYCDTESAVTNKMLSERGIDLTRIIKSEPETIEQFRQTILQLLDKYMEVPEKQREPLLIVLDSLGNLSSVKEVEDIRAEKDTRDMTKAGLIRGTFRVLRLRLAKANVPMVVTNHVYQVVGSYIPTKALSGGCLVAGTPVILPDGSTKNIENFEIGDVVSTAYGPCNVTSTFKFTDKQVYEITLESGEVVRCSGEHKFIVDGQWKNASDLTINDKVAVVRNINDDEDRHDLSLLLPNNE